MSETTLNVSGAQIMAILGQKEVERLLLLERVAQLEALVKELTPPVTDAKPNLEVVT